MPDTPKRHGRAFTGFKRHGGAEGRPSAGARGYGWKWQQYAKAFLAAFPWCVRCLAARLTVRAVAVDHIERVTGPDDPKFWVRSNHQSLCRTCHGVKSAAERRGQAFDRANPYPPWEAIG